MLQLSTLTLIYEPLFAIQFLDAHISKQIDQRLTNSMTVGRDLMHQTKALSEKMTVGNTAGRSLWPQFKSRSLIMITCFYICHQKKRSKSTIFFPTLGFHHNSLSPTKIMEVEKLIFQDPQPFHDGGNLPPPRSWATSPSSGSTSQQREPRKAGIFYFFSGGFFLRFFSLQQKGKRNMNLWRIEIDVKRT